jgi:5'-3' exoribonuclease 2
MPRSVHIHKSMLLRGVKFGPSVLNAEDIAATKGRANHSGRSFGGAPLGRGRGRGRGGQMNYTEERPNPFAAHINPGYGHGPPPTFGRGGPPPNGQYNGYPPPPPRYSGAPPPAHAGYYNNHAAPQSGYAYNNGQGPMSGYGNSYYPPPQDGRYSGYNGGR